MFDEIRDILEGSRATIMGDALGVVGLFGLLFVGLSSTGII